MSEIADGHKDGVAANEGEMTVSPEDVLAGKVDPCAERPEPYHYTMCGLDDVYLINGVHDVSTAYGPSVIIHDIDGLHQAIAQDLARNKKALNGKEMRFLRKQMDLTQLELSYLLSVSDQSIARWEKGEVDVSGPAELSMRALYLSHDEGKIDAVALAKHIKELSETEPQSRLFEDGCEGWRLAEAA